jgi:heme-degrading monooxygenase HmoA
MSDCTSSDGESVTIVELESHETLAAWRNYPEHRAVQEKARAQWFSTYRISVADVVRDKVWSV